MKFFKLFVNSNIANLPMGYIIVDVIVLLIEWSCICYYAEIVMDFLCNYAPESWSEILHAFISAMLIIFPAIFPNGLLVAAAFITIIILSILYLIGKHSKKIAVYTKSFKKFLKRERTKDKKEKDGKEKYVSRHLKGSVYKHLKSIISKIFNFHNHYNYHIPYGA